MLTSQLYDAQGDLVGVDLGLDGVWSTLKSVGSAAGSATKTVGKTVARAGKTAGKAVYKAGAKAADVIEDGAHYACKAVSNPSVQKGAQMAAKYGKYIPPNPYVPGAVVTGVGYGVETAGALCSMAYPKKVKKEKAKKPKPPKPIALKPVVVKPVVPPTLPAAPLEPPGLFQWYERKTGKWKIAVARHAGAFGGLGQAAVGLRRREFDVNAYYATSTADSPYLSSYTHGALHTGLGQAAADIDIVTADQQRAATEVVSEEEGQRRTGTLPWYKTYKLWLVVGAVSIVGAGTASAIVLRRRTRQGTKEK